MKVLDQEIGENFAIYNGDCIEVINGIPDNSIHYSIFSPPFASLFTYSDSDRDMGNSDGDASFREHFAYLPKELNRVIMPGRCVSIHCMNIPAMKERDGFIGLKDFRGDIIRAFQAADFIFHSEVCIWKDPLIEATRTKALGLMHKQIQKDSSKCRMGLPDYIVTMRKKGDNTEPIDHAEGFTEFHGENEPEETGIKYSHNVWRRYANPVWADINQSNTLNGNLARAKDDERHICPLQLDTIARCLDLWSNPMDTILSPFGGIMSEGYQALLMDRRYVGIELKAEYFNVGKKYLIEIENAPEQMELFG